MSRMLTASLARWRKAGTAALAFARAPAPLRLARLLHRADGALLQVENTNTCNYRCTYCPTHSERSLFKVRKGHMTLDTFRAILDRHPRAALVVIQGQGEPLMDPGVFEKIAACRERRIATQIISNGSLLGEAMNERLRREGPDMLLFSVDCVSPERNMEERRGMKYHRVLAGIRALAAGRRAPTRSTRSMRPMVLGLLSIVHGPFDAEVEAALRSFNGIGLDIVYYKQLNASYDNRIGGYRAPAVDGIPASLRRALDFVVSHQRVARVRPCAQLAYDLPYYLWEGGRTPCCVLNDPRYSAPEFERDRLLERYRERRLPGECERCSFFGGYERAS